MKVCTDSCLYGAWVADEIQNKTIDQILDIGCGTGLLSLMLAQKTKGFIDAVELNAEAIKDARINIGTSSFSSRINLIQEDFLQYSPDKFYDLIICNPPFYENDLRPADKHREAAMHEGSLNLNALINKVIKLLAGNGIFAILYPFNGMQRLLNVISAYGLFPEKIVSVKNDGSKQPFRCMLICSAFDSSAQEKEIVIKTRNGYSAEFEALLKDYYLFL